MYINRNSKPELTERCRLGALPGADCAHGHVARALDKGIGGSKSLRLCPGHDGREATLSINPGRDFRVVWNELAETCDLEDREIHALLLSRGVDESCLGTYGLRKQGRQANGQRVQAADPAMLADAGRAHAIAKLPMDLAGHLYKMCVQAIMDGPGDLAGDPFTLLPEHRADFIDLARRCGFERSYCRKLWLQWEALRSVRAGVLDRGDKPSSSIPNRSTYQPDEICVKSAGQGDRSAPNDGGKVHTPWKKYTPLRNRSSRECGKSTHP